MQNLSSFKDPLTKVKIKELVITNFSCFFFATADFIFICFLQFSFLENKNYAKTSKKKKNSPVIELKNKKHPS